MRRGEIHRRVVYQKIALIFGLNLFREPSTTFFANKNQPLLRLKKPLYEHSLPHTLLHKIASRQVENPVIAYCRTAHH